MLFNKQPWFLILSISILVVSISFGVYQKSNLSNQDNSIQKIIHSVQNNLTPTPFPFHEMTIPSLRTRDYKSKLSKEKYLDKGEYTSYLSSYDSDGLKINALLTIPNGLEPVGGWPAVVFVHGYIPPTLYQTTKNYDSYVDSMAKRGLVVLKIDLRGHDKSEGIPHGAYYSEGYVVDVLNAYEALKGEKYVNPDNIGLWGHSMAGNVTFRAFVAKQSIPKLSIWAGAVYTYEDLQKYSISDNSYRPPVDNSERQRRRDELDQIHGDFDPKSTFWMQVVPTNYLSGVKGEVQIHHSINDNVVDIGYSRDLAKILENSKIKNELFEYSIGGHNITDSAYTKAMDETVKFLKDY